jgi:hypothetical protein
MDCRQLIRYDNKDKNNNDGDDNDNDEEEEEEKVIPTTDPGVMGEVGCMVLGKDRFATWSGVVVDDGCCLMLLLMFLLFLFCDCDF